MPVIREIEEPSVQNIVLTRQISSLGRNALLEKVTVMWLANILLALSRYQLFIDVLATALSLVPVFNLFN
jgi:hypothetical protein